MVFSEIFLVRGVLVDRDTFLSIFKDDLKDLCVKHNEDEPKWDPQVWEDKWDDEYFEGEGKKSFTQALCEVMDISSPDLAVDLYWDFLHGSDNLFPYPCCSKLAEKRWVVGIKVGGSDVSPEKIFNTTVTLEDLMDKIVGEKEWEAFAKERDLDDLIPRTYLMLDDCVFCS